MSFLRFALAIISSTSIAWIDIATFAQQPAEPAATTPAPTQPIFKDGLAQEVEGFKNSNDWIRHDLWVETEFDSDGNGKRDRMHVDVTRPKQTDTEGLKVPVVYETSPYYSRQGEFSKSHFWDPSTSWERRRPSTRIWKQRYASCADQSFR